MSRPCPPFLGLRTRYVWIRLLGRTAHHLGASPRYRRSLMWEQRPRSTRGVSKIKMPIHLSQPILIIGGFCPPTTRTTHKQETVLEKERVRVCAIRSAVRPSHNHESLGSSVGNIFVWPSGPANEIEKKREEGWLCLLDFLLLGFRSRRHPCGPVLSIHRYRYPRCLPPGQVRSPSTACPYRSDR